MNHKKLYSTYKRVKENCCEEWEHSAVFYKWYDDEVKKQDELCHYCSLPGDTNKYYGTTFRNGNRGSRLEVDKKDNKKPYSPSNCVLACYPCNNAKSDVFTYEEFLKIGKIISKEKKGG